MLANVSPVVPQFPPEETASIPEAFAHLFDPAADDTQPLKLFALLDAAQIPLLPDLLDQSGLPHECLFQGDALEDMAEVAPWIVQLLPDQMFTRRLFTDPSDDPGGLWGSNAYVLATSSAPLATVRKHFRKFLKVQDRSGKWFFLRFYDPDHLFALLEAMAPDKGRQFMGPVAGFMMQTRRGWVSAS